MRLVASRAAISPHHGVLVGERARLVRVALQATRLVAARRLQRVGQNAAMRIVAIGARHGTLGHLVFERLLEARPDVLMAKGTLLIDAFGLRDRLPLWCRLVHRMAGGAGHLIPGMAASDAPGVCGLIAMAGEAGPVGLGCAQFRGIANVGGRCRFSMHGAGSMACLTGVPRRAPLRVGLKRVVCVLAKAGNDVLVAALADLGTGEGRGSRLAARLLGFLRRGRHGSQRHQRANKKDSPAPHPVR